MKTSILYGPNDLRVVEIGMPKPGLGEVLIRVKACCICGSDIHIFKGDIPWSMITKMAHASTITLGHEFSGDIAEIGEGVIGFNIGDRVTAEPNFGCGKCTQCITGHYGRCDSLQSLGVQKKGAFAEYVTVPSEYVIKIPDYIPYDEAAMVEPFSIGVHTINRSCLHAGDTVAILGAGPIGLSCLQIAKIYGARRTIVTDIFDEALKVASKMGASVTINSDETDPVKKIMDLTEGVGVDIVFETAGVAQTIQQAMSVIRKGGRVVIVALHKVPREIDLLRFVLNENEIIATSNFGYYGLKREYDIAAHMMFEGKLDPKLMITHRFPLTEIKEAFDIAAKRYKTRALKVVVEPR